MMQTPHAPAAAQQTAVNHLLYTLQLADNALVLGHRLSEWTGHGPVLEQDIAITNMALDHLGAARSLYQHAANQFNALDRELKGNLFKSPALNQRLSTATPQPHNVTEDDLAFLRDAWDYRNLLLVELPNRDWAYTIARSFFYDSFNYLQQAALVNSADKALGATAEKSLKEVTYHRRWSSEWLIRLGDGTDESHERIQKAVNDYWAYTGEMFVPAGVETEMIASNIAADVAALKTEWEAQVQAIFTEAKLIVPQDTWMQEGGKDARHTEHLGYLLAEMQFMQRAYPGMEW